MSAVLAMSALLKAGVSPSQVIEYSSEALETLGSKFKQQVETVWGFAVRQGASLSAALEQLHSNQKQSADLAEKLRQANAVPKSTRQLMVWLPPISIALAELGGLRPLAGLATPLGASVAALGLALLLFGWFFSGRMLAKLANPLEQYLGLMLVQLGLRSGLSIQSALAAVEQDYNLQPVERDLVLEIAEISTATGAPVLELLEAGLENLLAEQRAERLEAVSKLSVRLLIPLSLTVIPSMLLLTVVPVFIGLFGGGEQ